MRYQQEKSHSLAGPMLLLLTAMLCTLIAFIVTNSQTDRQTVHVWVPPQEEQARN